MSRSPRREGPLELITDMLVDLMRLCDREDVPFRKVALDARELYEQGLIAEKMDDGDVRDNLKSPIRA